VSIRGRKMTLAAKTVYHNGSIDTRFGPPLFFIRQNLYGNFSPTPTKEPRVNPKFKPNLVGEILSLNVHHLVTAQVLEVLSLFKLGNKKT
jgi:hypothetical protein